MGSGERFDAIARVLGGTVSRRRALKMAVGGAAGMAGASAMVALNGGVASAACVPGCGQGQQCCTTNTPPNTNFCAPATYTCCGNEACPPGVFQCCTTAVPNFCAAVGTVCCGRFACPQIVSQCCVTGTEPHCEPAIFQCCGDTSCPPGQTCVGYPAPGVCV